MDRKLRLVLALAVLTSVPAAAEKPEVHAIVGARVVTVSGAVLEPATVVLRDGVIQAVGATVAVPPDARVLDGKGLTLTPGLIDGFSGLGLPAPSARAPGAGAGASTPGPGPLAPQAMALDRLKAAEMQKARDTGVTTALVIPKEGVLPGQSVLVNLSSDQADAMVLKQPAALHLHMATLFRQYPGSLMGTVAYVRQALYDAARYRVAWAAWERAPGRKRPRYDAALAAWQEAAAGREPLVVTALRENDLRRALALADEFKLKVVLAGAPQASRLAPLLKQRKVPLLVSVNFDPPRAAGGSSEFGGRSEEQERRDIDEAERNPAALHKAGVPFGLVSAYAPDFLAGVRKAIERGLPREAALRAVTLGAAEALGVADRLGSLEAGKIANVVAWAGDPLTREAKVRMVFVDGLLFEPEERKDAPERKGEDKKADATTSREPPPLPPLPEPGPDKPVAIVGGTVLTLGPLGTIEAGTVLLRGGKIAAVGREVAVPEGATVIDAKGRYVMPGIIDTHSHNAIEGGVNECTSSVTAEVRIADVIDHRDVDIYRQLAGGVTTLNVLHGSCNVIGGQNAVIKLRWGRSPQELLFEGAPRGIKFALGENVKRSNFRAPGAPPRFPGTRMGVENVLRESFQEARAYGKEWEDYDRRVKAAGAGPKPVPPRRDLRLETLRDVLDGKVYVHAHCYRSDEILMLLRVADEFGFKIRTLQHGLEAYKVASEIARHGTGVGTFIDWWAFKLEAYDATPYNPAILFRHGVTVTLNSDSNELARRLYWDAAKAVKYGGVPELEALKMITLNAARQLGIDQRVGSIEAGKDADLAIFAAHPLSPEARCEMTLVDGVAYFDRARDLAARATRDDLKAAAGGGQ
jgi:imidazolonepropionase-like amidohydrolase